MKADGKAIQVTDVQRAKVMVESIVEEAVVDGKVTGRRTIVSGARG